MDILPIALTAVVAVGLFITYHLFNLNRHRSSGNNVEQAPEKDLYSIIHPVHADFDWRTTPPIKIRPFKPKYHLSMSLENLDMSDLIAIDNTYADRMRIRRETMDKHPEATRQCNPGSEPAVFELYDWMVSMYLPHRFPNMYKLTETPSGPQLLNLVSNTYMPLSPTSPMAALETLGEHVDTDFLFLYPRSKAADGSEIYHLEAFITCFAAGFSTREKCGNPLATIHAPVPGYAAKLEKSMDRFFAKIEVGRVVKRANWSVSTNDKLYSDGGNHLYGDGKREKPPAENAKTLDVSMQGLDAEVERQKKEVVVEDCRLRCERQTLHRLPKTKALVFAFKTYLYRLSEVKEEGLGPTLAEAIDGLGGGSVPGMAFYKRGVVWGDKVKEYLNG